MKLIDADALKENYDWAKHAPGVYYGDVYVREIIKDIDRAATIDAVPVVRGRWLQNVRWSGCMVCSECGFGIKYDTPVYQECNRRSDEREYCMSAGDTMHHCPNCGAKMEELT